MGKFFSNSSADVFAKDGGHALHWLPVMAQEQPNSNHAWNNSKLL